MGAKFLRMAGYWALGLLMLIATAILVHWAITFVNWSGIDSGWAQAIGSVAAILASFFLFRRQREHELQLGHDDELRRRLFAMQAVSDVAYRSIAAIKRVAEAYMCHFPPGVDPDLTPRLPELRAILDRFADPTADRIVVIVALTFSTALAETQDDIRVRDRDLEGYVSQRLHDRIIELEAMQDRLITQLVNLENVCRARGIVVAYGEAVIAGD